MGALSFSKSRCSESLRGAYETNPIVSKLRDDVRSGPPHNETTPSITLTETTTKTTITTPQPGFSKRVTETHCKTKQVKVCPERRGMLRSFVV
ncbi:hypothetical protein OSTOST_20696 [Ostertagia ostertagi]